MELEKNWLLESNEGKCKTLMRFIYSYKWETSWLIYFKKKKKKKKLAFKVGELES